MCDEPLPTRANMTKWSYVVKETERARQCLSSLLDNADSEDSVGTISILRNSTRAAVEAVN